MPADLPDAGLAAAIEREMRVVLEKQWRFVGTPALTAYLDAVARQVVPTVDGAPPSVRVVLLEDAGLKTLALPSGTLVLSLGTLVFLEDEAELAFVLAHELTHAACADAATRLVRLGFDVLTKDAGESSESGFCRAANDLIALGYGRHRERDADARGLEAVLALGYDPESVLRYLRRLQQMVERGDPRVAEISAAHPTAVDRMRRLDKALFGRTASQHGRVNREVFRRAAGHTVLTTRLVRVRGLAEAPAEARSGAASIPRRVLAWVAAALVVALGVAVWWAVR